MQKVIVQILRAPSGGIRKHVLDIIDNLSGPHMKQIFITNVDETDVDLSYLKKNPYIEVFHAPIIESPGFHDFVNILKIYGMLRKRKVDVLHGHGAKGGLYARVLAVLLWTKCIYTPHGGSLHRVHGKLKNALYDFIERVMMPFTDIFLFESQYTANAFSENIKHPKSKMVINYNGVDIPEVYREKRYQSGERIYFASFGLLRELKGHDIFIKTCALLKERSIPFSYVIYGNGEFKSPLTDLIIKSKLEDDVKILDYSVNVYAELIKYDFIVHPSRFESFGYVPVEAMSVKVPVIVSNEGGLKEVVDNLSGYISYENTPESYLEIIEKLFKGDPDLGRKIDNAYNRAQSLFSKSAMLAKISSYYLR